MVHLLHDREQIKQIIEAEGKAAHEVENILNTLNGWRPSQFDVMYKQ